MIIGVCGLIGSGKGTVADMLIEDYNFKKLSFADKLKDSAAVLFDYPRELLEGDTEESRAWREEPDEFWSKETGQEITPRLVLQLYGTECMRRGFYNDIWVSIVKQKILQNPTVNYVLPDTRFPNEISMIQQIGGEVWQVRRGIPPGWFANAQLGIMPRDIHPSETSWIQPDENFDNVLDNDGTKADLRNLVQEHLDAIEFPLFAKSSGS